MNDDVITCLGYARACVAVLFAPPGASWAGRAGIDWHFAAQSRRGKRAPERARIHAALGLGRHAAAHHRRADPRLSHNSGDHARRTSMRAVAP